ncbi:asparagine--tRNA ligase, chloroplastic/mitochondrial [Diospyros lotus]|uniref:asparagine--tRNA ligase, chloroplastic/mitochondrial n=1 Tax=Diospyros lotus TaxID=55363 RepID=UPI0022588F6E|nr:asparagine--tRNA ligase, chloroplastic/mitochondrial [Diospyros lotus]XP_052209384.1 asparagine--tRNA ligase, chloroplastic/mitochondrial [Diospyros lotus]
MAAALSPASSLRLNPYSAVRFLSVFRKPKPTWTVLAQLNALTPNPPIPPKPIRCLTPFPFADKTAFLSHRRSLCAVVAGAFSSGGAVENPTTEPLEKKQTETSSQVGEFRKRLRIVDIKGGPDEGLDRLGQTLVVQGWVRTLRGQSSVTFIEVNDGSCLSNMQCVMNSDAEGYDQWESGLIATGASIWVQGTLVASQGSKQKVELKVEKLKAVGKSDPSFPIQKKRVSREFLRLKAHLRSRTNTFGAVARVRNALAYATHKFFQENGFVWISSPIITASDCEGAGEQFCVTTLIPSCQEPSNSPVDAIPKTKDGFIDWSQDFFGKPAFLTVSGQLNAETYATALSDVYTFGPTFRAENSNTSRHLAEFWMIEPELAFADLNDDMACATAYLQYVVKYVLEHCKEDMDFFNTWIEKGIINRLSDVVEKNVIQLSYTDAIELLLRANKKFEFPVKWGCDLQSEHERYIAEEAFGGCPVIIRDYPKEIKAFYMRQNDDGKTVAAMDMLVPRVGELIGGSQREERLEYLEDRLAELKLDKESYWWYLDLRRYGSVPHAGFGLGFERLVQFATGIENIRDAIPFPRTPGSAEF